MAIRQTDEQTIAFTLLLAEDIWTLSKNILSLADDPFQHLSPPPPPSSSSSTWQ
jgi:hypothetical protein